MAIPSVSDFRCEFIEFAQVPDADIIKFLDRAAYYHNATKRGTLYAAAHLYCIEKEKPATILGNGIESLVPDGGAGVVAGEGIGGRSVSYDTQIGGNYRHTFWARTPYGREFMKIEERNPRQALGVLIA